MIRTGARSRKRPAYDPDWRTKSKKAGGGCLLDNGYHNLYLSRAFLQDDVKQVYAATETYTRRISVDDTAFVLLRHRHGGTSSIQTAWSVSAGGTPVHEIHGTEGSISFTTPKPGEAHAAPLALFSNRTGKWTFPSIAKIEPNSFAGLLREWGTNLDAWLKAGKRGTPPSNAADSLRNHQVIEAAYRSSRTLKAVDV
jgi:predicted dehydrogenase